MSEIQKIDILAVGQYNGHITKRNRLLELRFKFSYDERTSLAKILFLVGQNIEVSVKAPDKKPVKLGTYNFQALNIDRDGQGHLKIITDIDYVEHENLVSIINDNELLKIKLSAEIELEENEDNE